jgi:hypothetical protein
MSFALNVRPEAELDIATAFGWYESELRAWAYNSWTHWTTLSKKLPKIRSSTQIWRQEFDGSC